jgi:N-carbamoylputrescine amidase
VCELSDDGRRIQHAWYALIQHLSTAPTDLLVLPEMPFLDWTMFTKRTVDEHLWRDALDRHDAVVAQFPALHAGVVVGSRPVEIGGRRLNQSFAWTREGGYQASRSKVDMPDETDGWEASWFDRGEPDAFPIVTGDLRVGFQICTEMLFTDLSWKLGRVGAQIIAAPRATGDHRRWNTAATLDAIVSGCFVASANRRSYLSKDFAGKSWIISPEGEQLAETTAEVPFASVDIDLTQSEQAKQTYPRNLARL